MDLRPDINYFGNFIYVAIVIPLCCGKNIQVFKDRKARLLIKNRFYIHISAKGFGLNILSYCHFSVIESHVSINNIKMGIENWGNSLAVPIFF